MPELLLTYYYYLKEDDSHFDALRSALATRRWDYVEPASLPLSELPAQPSFFELDSGNARVLVLYQPSLSGSWSEWDGQSRQLDELSGISNSILLGKVQVLVSEANYSAQTAAEISQPYPRSESLIFDINDGQVFRYGGTSGPVTYLAVLHKPNRRHTRFLTEQLPLIQLTIIRLQMMSNLMRDRNQIVSREKADLDRRLNQVLHTGLVVETGQIEVINELEEHLKLLSTGYGKIVNDFSIILDGQQRIESLLDQLRRQLSLVLSSALSPELREQIFDPFERRLDDLKSTLGELRISRENHQAAIEVVRSRIDLLMSKENIATQSQIRNLLEVNTSIQKQSLTFQFAAGLIEFIILAYYSHSLWKALAPDAYHTIAGWIQFLIVIAFSGNTVYLTHLLAEYIQGEEHIKKRLLIFSLPLLFIFLLVFIISALLTASAAH